jgi:hypothetical protein
MVVEEGAPGLRRRRLWRSRRQSARDLAFGLAAVSGALPSSHRARWLGKAVLAPVTSVKSPVNQPFWCRGRMG